ncbi:hypothetical protein T10_2501 [Trichinella papuae]|uniref:Uncharacterized protein n=1 Tax=Trichinella papuae TaxID=268474 RepID=A0A0V1N8V4_9BILA|nr:hypothetical protein T10_2501 [Trichinella papuae]
MNQWDTVTPQVPCEICVSASAAAAAAATVWVVLSSSYLLVFFIFVQFRVCCIHSRRIESFMITTARGRRVVGKLVQCLEVTVVNGRHRFARIENTIRTFHHDTI